MNKPATQKPVKISRTFDLPLARLWQAWTQPEALKEWWGPAGYTCPYSSIDLRVGGKNLNCMRSEEGDDFWSTGTYKEIVPHKKLVCTDNFSDEKGNILLASELGMPGSWPAELLVTVTFEEEDGKTVMNFQHDGVPAEIHDDCKLGWQQSFDKLALYL